MPSAYTTPNIQIGINLMVPNAASYLVTAIVYVIPHALAMTIGAEIPFATTDGLGGERLNTTTARPTKTDHRAHGDQASTCPARRRMCRHRGNRN